MKDEKYLLDALCEIVGSAYVVTDYKELEKYAHDGSFVKPMRPLCAAKPQSAEEVQNIVRLANRVNVAIFPYSSGTTYQGAHIPTEPGITVDLSRMTKIDLLDTIARNAIVEPGVTFAQLSREATKVGLKPMTPVGIPERASVLAAYLENTPLYLWPRYKTWEMLNVTMVMPTGEIMGTGQMALPASERPYHWTTNFAVLNRLFFGAQGTFGIGVKGVVTLRNLVTRRKVLFTAFKDFGQISQIVPQVMHQEAHDEFFIVNDLSLACLLSKDDHEILPIKNELPSLVAVIGISGNDEEEIAYKELDILDVLQQYGLKSSDTVGGIEDSQKRIMDEIDHPRGIPHLRRYKGACNYIACMASRTQLKAFYDITMQKSALRKDVIIPVGLMVMPLNFGGSYYFEPTLHHNPSSKEESEAAKLIFMQISKSLIHAGGFFPRPYPMWAEEVYFRMGVYHRRLKMLKRLYDPKNIMNPGKLALG